jgi:hypothetical protein
MKTYNEILRDKSDTQLIAIAHGLAAQLDLVGNEQTRRIALLARENHAAQDIQENEGGLSPAASSLRAPTWEKC